MILPIIQVVAVSSIAIYLGRSRFRLARRSARTWESLIARLRHDWSARGLSDHFLWKEGLNATPEEAWECIQGARGLWAMYQNAGVMLEMADFAAQNSDSVDQQLLETLRNDAMQIRGCALRGLAQYALNQASDAVRMHAFSAASMYTGMAARMTQLLQANAEEMLPSFVAAM
jgi:hypothetical protein